MGAGGLRPGGEMDAVRSACDAAVAGLADARPDLVVVVGDGDVSGAYDAASAGSLREYGVSYLVGTGTPVLPLSLTLGAWLLLRAGLGAAAAGAVTGQPQPARPSVRLHAVAQDTPVVQCLRLGAELAGSASRVAMLVMGEGSARKVTGSPGAADPAADRYDSEVAAALTAADAAFLSRLAPSVGDELMVSGRAAWQVLAGAAEGGHYRGCLRYAAQPYAVSYLVASWDACP
jgi:hypothetical protein